MNKDDKRKGVNRHMNTKREEIVEGDILSLVKNYCGSRVVSKFIADQKSGYKMERRVLDQINGQAAPGTMEPELSLNGGMSHDHLMTLCKQNLNDDEYQGMLLGIGNIFKQHGRLDKAEQMYGMVIGYGRKANHSDYAAEALLRRGEVYSLQARWVQAAHDLDSSRQLFLKSNNAVAVARIDNIFGANDAEQGHIKKAEQWFAKALRRFERSKQKPMTGTVMMNLGIVKNIAGNWDEALSYYRRALPFFQEAGDLTRIAELRHNMGMSYHSKGNYQEAIREFDKSLVFSQQLYNPRLIGLSELGKASAYFRLNDRPLALVFCNQALGHFTAVNSRLCIADGYKLKGMIFREMKEYNLAETYFQSSLLINEEHTNLLNLAETHHEIGIMHRQRRRRKAADASFRTALKYFKSVGAGSDVVRTQASLSRREST
ncbi:MAG TPA: tetratricopeptide repeat protein [Bacteroidota bacterium]|nr:tetratricopeptide repeat protein [Bacteroidota bacterium]